MSDPNSHPHTAADDGLAGSFGDAVLSAARGPIAVTAAETERAWQQLDARIAAGFPANDQVIPLTSRRRSLPRWSYAAAALLALGAIGLWQQLSPARDTVTAPRGQRVAVTLPDGSLMTLAAGSRASWTRGFRRPWSFGPSQGAVREVRLEGEAHFAVAHDNAHPFLVRARGAVAQDVGTRFVVRAWPERVDVDISVEEGIVAVSDSTTAATLPVARRTQLRAGQRGVLAADGRVAIAAVDSVEAFSWLTGTLVFADVPAREAIAALARWYDVTIELPPALADRRLTARFDRQSLNDVAQGIALSLGATVTRTESARGVSLTFTP
jgi:transmembrane sensor